MLLKECKIYVVATPKPYFGGKNWFFIKLVTDDGIEGWGEAYSQKIFYPLKESFKKLSAEIFEHCLKGRDPMQRSYLMRQAYNELSANRPGLMAGSLLSAFDLALWDIAGKSMNVPVYQMIGGKFRDRIRAYSYLCRPEPDHPDNQPTRHAMWGNPDIIRERSLEMVEEGFTAIKFDPLRYLVVKGIEPPIPYSLTLDDLKLVDDCMAAIRDAVGDRCDILLGTHGQMTTASAITLAKLIEPYRPLWFEEPVPPENVKEMAKVRKSTSIPIASGERLSTAFEFQRLLEEDAVSVVQPDPGSCGGITECVKIMNLCQVHYAEIAPHVSSGPIVTAAALQIAAAAPNFLMQENVYKSEHFTSRLLTHSMGWDNGYFKPLERPGLGIEVDEKEVLRHCV